MRILSLLIAALLPFERIGSFSVGGANVRPSQVALLLLIPAAARSLIHSKEKIRWQPEWFWLIVFLGFNVLSLLNAENLPRSLFVLGFTVFTASLAFILPLALKTPEDFSRVRAAVLISAAAVGAFGLWQFIGDMFGAPAALTGLRPHYTKAILGFTRVQSTAAEPLYFADYLLLPMGLALSWVLSGVQKYRKPLLALLGLLFVNLILTASRGGYAGFIAMGAAVIWMHRRRLPAFKKILPLALAAVVLAITVIAAIGRFAVTTPEPLSASFIRHVVTVTDGAAFVERSETIGKALGAFARHPWIGVGVGGYGPFFATYATIKPEAGWAIVNNEPLELLAEVGILGLAAFIMFIATVLRAGARQADDANLESIRIGALAALIGMLVHYQTFSTLYIMHVWFTIGLILALTGRARNGTVRPENIEV